MSTRRDRLRDWAEPRKWSIVGGLVPVLLGLLIFGLVTQDWGLTAGGFIGLIVGASGVVVFVVNPALWERERRWKVLGLWVAGVSLAIVLVVIVVFLLSDS
jgi:uncharacterized membrane protein